VEIVLLYGHGDGGYLAGCFHEQFDNKFVRRSLLHSADAREKTDCEFGYAVVTLIWTAEN